MHQVRNYITQLIEDIAEIDREHLMGQYRIINIAETANRYTNVRNLEHLKKICNEYESK